LIHWLLDNGHGAIDPFNCEPVTPGKRSPEFPIGNEFEGQVLIEGVRNRAVVNYLSLLLTDAGIMFTNLVPTWHDTPLKDRVVLANRIAAIEKKEGNQCIYLSIHHDAYGGDWNSANGTSAHYYPTSTIGAKLAKVFNEEIVASTDLRKRGAKDSDFYVLRKTSCPAVLTENGFMTNLKDATFCMAEEGSQTIAKGHFEAIKYINETFKIMAT